MGCSAFMDRPHGPSIMSDVQMIKTSVSRQTFEKMSMMSIHVIAFPFVFKKSVERETLRFFQVDPPSQWF
jgi:hypothetical protein